MHPHEKQASIYPLQLPLECWSEVRIIHAPPHNVIESAAAGEALLRFVREPVIVFVPKFNNPTLSIGYFQSAKEVSEGTGFVRRLTGGGLVDAAGGLSLSAMVPPEHPRYRLSREECYLGFNSAVAGALADCGLPATVADQAPEFDPGLDGVFGACFGDAFRFDIVAGKKKVAASSTHKNPHGMMQEIGIHSSIPSETLIPALIKRLLPLFGSGATESVFTPTERLYAVELIRLRYATRAWNHAR